MDANPSNCPRCGSVVPAEAAAGLCPRCLAVGALSALQNPDSIVVPVDEPGPPPGGGTIRYFGDYELLQKAGEGGMGVIWKARQISLNRIVAVKMVRLGKLAGDADRQRFRTEAEAAARLQHPNIVALHEVGEHDGQPYFSMDYVEGRSLAELVREQPLEPAHAARLVKAVAEAIHYAHQRGVLHRDLKPSNVMCDAEDQPRVTDFGLAKLMQSDSELTRTGAFMGSPSYMPPEQAAGRLGDMNERSDVYSIGAVLYELITGQAPFRAATMAEIIRLVVERDPIAPRAFNPALPRDLETICLKCLAKEPSRRYGTALEMAEELGRFLRDEPIHARPAGARERMWRWCRRKPALAGALAAAAIILLLGVGGVFWQWRRAEQKSLLADQRLYAADMHLAQEAWRDSNLGRTKAFLEPHLSQTNYHDFLWRYLSARTRGEQLAILRGHEDAVAEIAFSPDAHLLATRDSGHRLKVWTIPEGRERLTLTNVTGLGGFLPDNRTLIIGLGSNSTALCDVQEGACKRTWPSTGRPLAVLAGGKIIATTADDFRLKLWDLETGVETFRLPGRGGVSSDSQLPLVTTSTDGRRVASRWGSTVGHNALNFAVWDLQTTSIVFQTSERVPTFAMALSSDGSKFALGRMDGYVKFWDLDVSTNVPVSFAAHGDMFRALKFLRDGVSLATAGSDQLVKLFGLGTHRPWSLLRGHESSVRALAESPDGRWLASGDRDGRVMLWSIGGAHPSETYTDGADTVRNRICFSPDSRNLAVQSVAGTVHVLDVETMLKVTSVNRPWEPMCFSADGRRLLLGTSANRVWNLELGRLEKSVQFPVAEQLNDAKQTEAPAKEISRDGRLVAFGGAHGEVFVCDGDTGQLVARLSGHEQAVRSLAFLPNGDVLLSRDKRGDIHFWNLATKQLLGTIHGGTAATEVMALSPDGRTLCTGGNVSQMKLWDVTHRRLLHTFRGRGQNVLALAFTPDGRTLASASSEGIINLWNLVVRQEVGLLRLYDQQEMEQLYRISGLRFSPDGNTLAACSVDGIVRVWRAGPVSSNAANDVTNSFSRAANSEKNETPSATTQKEFP